MLAQARTTAVIVIPDDDDLAICHLTQLMGSTYLRRVLWQSNLCVQHGMIQVHAPSSLWSGTSDTKRKLRAQPSELQEVAIIFARMVEGTYRPVTCEHGTSSLCLDISTQ